MDGYNAFSLEFRTSREYTPVKLVKLKMVPPWLNVSSGTLTNVASALHYHDNIIHGIDETH